MLFRLVASPEATSRVEHCVISLTDLGEIGRDLREAGTDVLTLGMRGMRDIPLALIRLRRALKALRPDVVQTWMYHADLLGGIAAKLAGCRRIIWGVRTTHVAYEGSLQTVWVRRICAVLSRWIPEAIVCAADASLRAHIGAGYCARKMIVIPNGFDVTALANAAARRMSSRESLGFQSNEFVVGGVGRFNPVKDFRTFIRAARQIQTELPNTRFLLMGRDMEPANRELSDWIAEAGLVDRFVLLGERRDALDCIAAMDVYCLSSRSEGFPNVLGEAMGIGIPCVVTEVGDAAFLLGDGGVVVRSADPVALAAGVVAILRLDAAERTATGRRGQRRIHSLFTLQQSRDRFERLYLAPGGDQDRNPS